MLHMNCNTKERIIIFGYEKEHSNLSMCFCTETNCFICNFVELVVWQVVPEIDMCFVM
jgi:hypothetical protein